MLLYSHDILIALGANAPLNGQQPEVTLNQAIERLSKTKVEVVSLSRFYRTPAFPLRSGPDFVNAAARLRYDKTPVQLLELLHAVEAEFGRERVIRWGQRTLDLDLIATGDSVLPNREVYESWRALPPAQQLQQTPDEIILPHPRMQERAFVLVPLCDIAPDWCHPVLKRSIREMLLELPEAERAAIRPI
ncbi:MAG: 2-amino-4-hydroxy-6-hydroxymethyldihydropteridine diphosphokinase [Pseudomonadota bacterium]